MATASERQQRHTDVTVLRGVSYREYVRLIGVPANRHLRMAYFDGTLEIMSPIYFDHEDASRRMSHLITTVAEVLGLPYQGAGQMTWHRQGDGPRKGTGREADQSFFIPTAERRPRGHNPDLNRGDLPPDLWVEVDHRASPRARLPTYARLGIPEVWQYRVKTGKIRFLRLDGTGYRAIDQSLALPVLSPALADEALRHGSDLIESRWALWLRVWAEQFRPDPIA